MSGFKIIHKKKSKKEYINKTEIFQIIYFNIINDNCMEIILLSIFNKEIRQQANKIILLYDAISLSFLLNIFSSKHKIV
jgi:hypothetical protein